MTKLHADLVTHWTPIASLFSLRNEDEYDAAVERLNALVDEVGTKEDHPLYSLLDALGALVHAYEEQHHVIPIASGAETLQFLMEEHDLSSSELPELGSPSVVDRVLAGDEELNVQQVRALADRFHVSPAAFI
jgi:HTH-type transcriptional regulator/antitoxin HigA